MKAAEDRNLDAVDGKRFVARANFYTLYLVTHFPFWEIPSSRQFPDAWCLSKTRKIHLTSSKYDSFPDSRFRFSNDRREYRRDRRVRVLIKISIHIHASGVSIVHSSTLLKIYFQQPYYLWDTFALNYNLTICSITLK